MANTKEKIIKFLKSKSFIIGAASFVLPALALYVIFIINRVHPFGDKQILVTDLWHQYYPFLCELQERLKEGRSLLYSENIGLGINFWSLIAYYGASILNILVVFVSKKALRDLVVWLVVLKVGFSGLFFSMYLKKVHKRYDFSTVAFSMMYALCGYVLGYYWNIMWHDAVALLPLVMMGVYSIIKENKCILYVISLALAVISNFYIGFMVCIFTAIYFFAECACSKISGKDFLKKIGMIAVSSAVSLALTAFITIPAYNALQDTVSSVPKTQNSVEKTFFEKVEDTIKDAKDDINKDTGDVLGRLASFNEPVPKEGLPNIFSGFLCVVLLGFFISSKKISLSERISSICVIVILLLSMIVGDIDIIWHGFHKPNMVPYRYAFVLSFALISMAYKTYVAEFAPDSANYKIKKWKYIVSAALSLLIIFCAYNKAEPATLLGCGAIGILYLIILISIKDESSADKKAKWGQFLCGVVVVEMIINTAIAVPTVRTTTYSTYYYRGEEIERLLKDVNADESYARVETSQEYILNDPALYGYKGVSAFSSTVNYPVTRLIGKLGLCAPGRANRYYYETTSPLVNSFLSIEYVIFKNNMKNLNPYLEEEAEEWTEDDKYKNVIYKNTEVLPIGFLCENALLAEDGLEGENPFEVQNDLFRKATGLNEDLFTRIPLKSVSAETTVKVTGSKEGYYTLTKEDDKDNRLDINYTAVNGDSVYAYVSGKDISRVKISNTSYKVDKRTYVFPAGSYEEGDTFTFNFDFGSSFKKKGSLDFHVYYMNESLFEEGMEMLRESPFEIAKYTSTKIEGTINADKNGVLYTSIPYERGWKAYVDGKKAEIEPLEDAFISLYIQEGEHSIVLKYLPYGFTIGVVISVIALIILVLCIIAKRRMKNNGQDIGSSSLL